MYEKRLTELTANMVSAEIGIIDPRALRRVVDRARQSQEVPLVVIERTLEIEFWLRGLNRVEIVSGRAPYFTSRGTVQNKTDAMSSEIRAEFSSLAVETQFKTEKGVIPMKYAKPEVVELAPAIEAIQMHIKDPQGVLELAPPFERTIGAYEADE
ncbi:MAG: hypothetical protein WA823_14335 [Candidatus Acidiferrales bacterium]